MKNRLLALLLVVMMVLPLFVFTGCNKKKEGSIEGEESRTVMTISLWVPTINELTNETAAQIEKALNELTTTKYSTYVKMHFVQTDKYEKAVQARQEEIINAIMKGEKAEATETIAWDNGYSITQYPGERADQLDIFLIRGYEDYVEYIENGELEGLSSYYNNSSFKLIKSAVSNKLINWAEYNKTLYAVPNNHCIGDYTYLLVNKNICEYLYYDFDNMPTAHACGNYVKDVAKYADAIKETFGYTDLAPVLEPYDPVGIKYLSADGSKNLIATQEVYGNNNQTQVSIKSFLDYDEVVNNIYDMKLYTENNYFAEDPSTCSTFGMAVIKGNSDTIAQYTDDYYVKVLAAPMIENDDVYGSMYGISQFTVDSIRALEILSMINTDFNFRTVLQYGIEGVHWDYADENLSTIKKLSDDYQMNLRDTGNEFITFPDYGVSMDQWKAMKEANSNAQESSFLNVHFNSYELFGETVNGMFNTTTNRYLKQLETNTSQVYATIDGLDAAHFLTSYSNINKQIKAYTQYSNLCKSSTVNSFVYIYYTYLVETYPELYGTLLDVE